MLLLSRTVLLLTPMMQPPHAAPPCCRHVAPHLCADPPSADQLLMEAMTELRGGEAPKARALLSEASELYDAQPEGISDEQQQLLTLVGERIDAAVGEPTAAPERASIPPPQR